MWWLHKKKVKDKSLFTLRDKHKRYYNTVQHKKWRTLVLNEFPTCVECELKGLVVPSTEAHHVESLTIAFHKRTWLSNGVGLCAPCHNRISRGEQLEYRRIEREKRIDDNLNELREF